MGHKIFLLTRCVLELYPWLYDDRNSFVIGWECRLLRDPDCAVMFFFSVSRSDNSRRVTRPVARTREPEWRQTFSYRPVSRQQLMEKSIEVTVWNLKKSGVTEFLGEVRAGGCHTLIDL